VTVTLLRVLTTVLVAFGSFRFIKFIHICIAAMENVGFDDASAAGIATITWETDASFGHAALFLRRKSRTSSNISDSSN